MNIINFIEKNATPIGIIAGVVLGGAAAVCTYKAMTKAEKINNEPEEVVENNSEVEEKNETVEKAKALVPMLGVIALSVVGAKVLGNGDIFLAGLTGSLAGAIYAVVKSPYEDRESKKLTLKAGVIFSIVGTAIGFPTLNAIRYFIKRKEAIV